MRMSSPFCMSMRCTPAAGTSDALLAASTLLALCVSRSALHAGRAGLLLLKACMQPAWHQTLVVPRGPPCRWVPCPPLAATGQSSSGRRHQVGAGNLGWCTEWMMEREAEKKQQLVCNSWPPLVSSLLLLRLHAHLQGMRPTSATHNAPLWRPPPGLNRLSYFLALDTFDHTATLLRSAVYLIM